MYYLILHLITLLHTLYILFVLLIPFVGNNYFLILHSFVIPFMIFHWVTNNNTCALTMAEKFIRAKKEGVSMNSIEDKCFTCKLINPVYDFTNNYKKLSIITYVIVIILWIFTMYKIYSKYKNGSLNSLQDIFKL